MSDAAAGAPVIVPTPGRVVWFYPLQLQLRLAAGEAVQPQAALVAYAHDERLINLFAIPSDGAGAPGVEEKVLLLQAGDPAPEPGTRAFAMWMPYQQGQAARHQAPPVPPQLTAEQLEELKAKILADAAPAIAMQVADAIALANKPKPSDGAGTQQA